MSRALQIVLPFDTVVDLGDPTAVLAVQRGVSSVPPLPSVVPAATTTSVLAPVYFVRHRRARRYLLRVEPDGRLRVTIPRGGSRREAEAFAWRNRVWVSHQRERSGPNPMSAEERTALRARAAIELPARLRALAAEHQVTGVTRISIRNQRTRWGSCGRDGHITLNWRLVVMPADVRDYVMLHELMHLRRMDHSPAYWRLVAAVCPDFAAARAWLRTHGRALR